MVVGWSREGQRREALVVFQGPQVYVSPGWYPAKAEHGKDVWIDVEDAQIAFFTPNSLWVMAAFAVLGNVQALGLLIRSERMRSASSHRARSR